MARDANGAAQRTINLPTEHATRVQRHATSTHLRGRWDYRRGHGRRVICESAQGTEKIERYKHGDEEVEVAILQGRAEISGTCDI